MPAPDSIARDYLLLALRLDQHIPGLVDGYFGPAGLKAQVDMEQLRSPARLRDDAAALRTRLGEADVTAPHRRTWLEAQLVALEAQAAALAGDGLPYLDHVARCFDHAPSRLPDEGFEAAAARIDRLLPGDPPLADRLAAWDSRFEIPVDRLPQVAAWLIERFRSIAAAAFGLPDGEDLRLALVTGQPWGAYNWYHGGRRSRIDLNTDLPVTIPDLIRIAAHEAYPGHHLEQAWKEAELVDRQGRLEASILLINTPECLISEGLADVGPSFVAPAGVRADLLVELFERAGLPLAADPVECREAADRVVALQPERETLSSIKGNAAILRHVDGRSHGEVMAYLQGVGRYEARTAAHLLDFIEHPLWRTYVFVYAEGRHLVRQWLEAVPDGERTNRFGRLLREPLTPAALEATG